jgi:hypothetical protein
MVASLDHGCPCAIRDISGVARWRCHIDVAMLIWPDIANPRHHVFTTPPPAPRVRSEPSQLSIPPAMPLEQCEPEIYASCPRRVALRLPRAMNIGWNAVCFAFPIRD